MTDPAAFGELLGTAVSVPGKAGKYIAAATLAVADILLSMLVGGQMTDITRLKEALFREITAESNSKVAKADKKIAEAMIATNKATLAKRKDVLAKIEKEGMALANAKTEAEIEAIQSDTETRRLQAIAEAQAKLIEALSRLRQDGGDVLVSQQNLEQILRLETSKVSKGEEPAGQTDE